MKRAMETAAERLAVQQVVGIEQRRALLRDAVQDLQEKGYQVLLQPKDDGHEFPLSKVHDAMPTLRDHPKDGRPGCKARLAAQGDLTAGRPQATLQQASPTWAGASSA